MGNKPNRQIQPSLEDINKSYELVKEADKYFDGMILFIQISKPPLTTHILHKMIREKIVISKHFLFKSFLYYFPEPNNNYSPYISLHISRSKAKEGYFTHLNSLRSLLLIHKTKQHILASDYPKNCYTKIQLLEKYLQTARGCFSLQGLTELDSLLSSNLPLFNLILSLFKQTFEIRRKLDLEFSEIRAYDLPEVIPHGFQEAQKAVQEDLDKLQFPKRLNIS